jgi:hypothetical protein
MLSKIFRKVSKALGERSKVLRKLSEVFGTLTQNFEIDSRPFCFAV